MNSLPPERRGVGAGMSATFQNSAMVLSIGIFFTLIILGLASSLPGTLTHGLVAQGVPQADAARVAALPPVSIMFAALLGYNPVQTLLGPVISKLPTGAPPPQASRLWRERARPGRRVDGNCCPRHHGASTELRLSG